MNKNNSTAWILLSVGFSVLMNFPFNMSGKGLFVLVQLALPWIFAGFSLVAYFLIYFLNKDLKLIATVIACAINIYCGLMLVFNCLIYLFRLKDIKLTTESINNISSPVLRDRKIFYV